MSLQPRRIDRPRNEQDFEDWCLVIFRKSLDCPDLKKLGRRGQKQGGIDLIGNDRRSRLVSVQCKLRNDSALTLEDVRNDVESAKEDHPDLSLFVLATTAPRDAVLQRDVLSMSRENVAAGSFRIDILFWDDLEDTLNADQSLRLSLAEGLGGPEAFELLQNVPRFSAALDRFESVPSTDIDAEINEAFEHIGRGKPDFCFEQLEKLRKERWESLSDKHKFRVFANQGHARYSQNDFEEAARFYLKAREFSDTVAARLLEARANFFRNKSKPPKYLNSTQVRRSSGSFRTA